eukprot:jgi/Galph1/3046/GphlegSOOS_G1721.1
MIDPNVRFCKVPQRTRSILVAHAGYRGRIRPTCICALSQNRQPPKAVTPLRLCTSIVAALCTIFVTKIDNLNAAHCEYKNTLINCSSSPSCEQQQSLRKFRKYKVLAVTVSPSITPRSSNMDSAKKSLDFNTVLALVLLSTVAVFRLCYLLVQYVQQRREEKKMEEERQKHLEQDVQVIDDKDAIENFRRRMSEFSVSTDDEEEEDDMDEEEEDLRRYRRRSIDGSQLSGGWRRKRPDRGSSSAVFERPPEKNNPPEEPSSGVSAEQIEMLKRMYGGDIRTDDKKEDKDSKGGKKQ